MLNRANLPNPAPSHLASYIYGSSDPANNIGKPVEVSWGPNPAQNKDTFTYDAEGRPAKQTRFVSGQEYANEVTAYDALNQPTQVRLYTNSVAETIDIGYDQEGENSLTAGGTQLVDHVAYNERGQLTSLGRPGAAPETTLSYHGANKNFRLSGIANSGSTALPDFAYNEYDGVGNLTKLNISGVGYTYEYDELNRLLSVTDSLNRGYTYDIMGNFNSVTRGAETWTYGYLSTSLSRLMSITTSKSGVPVPLTVAVSGGYDGRGNLKKYTLEGISYELSFDVENRLASMKKGMTQTTLFAYDADGQRAMTTQPNGTKIYTPFPDYEVTEPPTGADTVRTTYRLGGQIVAVQTKVGAAAGAFYFTYTDHLGNISAMSTTAGVYVADSRAWYDPFGAFISDPTVNPPDVNPVPSSNPAISNHGFTNHGFTDHGFTG